jgi:type IV pilus assembly protein PilN
MQFTINLATRTYLDHRLVNRICISAVALLAIMLLWNLSRVLSFMGELQRLKSDIVTYEERLNNRPKDVPEKDYTRLLATISFYNEIIDRKTFNWLGLLENLENATPEGNALISLTPDRKSGEIKIDGRAHSFANLRAYLEKLDESKNFTKVLLLSQHDLVVSDMARGVQFTISCRASIK